MLLRPRESDIDRVTDLAQTGPEASKSMRIRCVQPLLEILELILERVNLVTEALEVIRSRMLRTVNIATQIRERELQSADVHCCSAP